MHAKSRKGRDLASALTDTAKNPPRSGAKGSTPAVTLSAAFKSALGPGGKKTHLPELADTHTKRSKNALKADRPDKPIQTKPERNMVLGPRQGHK